MINLRNMIVASALLAVVVPAAARHASPEGKTAEGCAARCDAKGGSAGPGAIAPREPDRPARGGGTPVPEPADFALFAAGIAGLLIGRRTSRRRRLP